MNVWMRPCAAGLIAHGGLLEVGAMAARQARDHRDGGSPWRCGTHGLGVGGRGDREPGLDDVHAERIELTGQLELLGRPERKPGCLLAVAQRRVENSDVFCQPSGLFPRRMPVDATGLDNVKMIIILFGLSIAYRRPAAHGCTWN